MTSGARFVGLAAACATLALAGGLAGPAKAQGPACKNEAVTVSGKSKFRPFSKAKEADGRRAAMANAVATWERRVGARFGPTWNKWSKARDTTFDCAPTASENVVGASIIGCTISGRPCASASASTARVPAPRRDKAGSEPATLTKGEPPPSNSVAPGTPVEYEREMERQEKLADQRRKEEADAYEREMQMQEKLANERLKGEYDAQPKPSRRR